MRRTGARAESRRNDWFGSLREPIDKTPLGKRRLRILSTLFKILEARGYKLIVEGPYRHQVFVGLKDEKLSITLEERLQQIRRLLTEEEKAKRSYLSTGQKWTQEKQATGELILNIKEAGGYGVSKEWRETSDDPLEARLNVVLGGIAAAFEEIRLRRERDAEERRKQWQLEEERRKLEMDRKREVIRYRRLVQSAENQQRAAHIRALVETVESSPRAKDDPEAFACRRNWALGHADRIDPINNDRLFDMEVPDSDVYMLRD